MGRVQIGMGVNFICTKTNDGRGVDDGRGGRE